MYYAAITAFLSGLVISEFFNLDWSVLALILVISGAIHLVIYESKTKILLIIGLCLTLGALRFSLATTHPDPNLSLQVGEKISLQGEVSLEPDVRDTSTRYIVEIPNSQSKILLVSERFPEFNYGDQISFQGKLELPENFVGDTGIEFDYVSYLSKDQIHFIIYRPGINLLSSGGSQFIKILFNLKNYFVSNVSKVVPEPNSSLASGLIFGTRQSLGNDLLEMMKNVGLVHIVAISGYNVTIIAAAILSITSYLGRRRLGLGLSAVSIILFAIMVGLGSTVIRASIMAIIAILARYLGRPNLALRALASAVFLMLLWNPLLLTRDPSFQLSAAAALGLILFSPIIHNKIHWITEKFGLREIVSSTFAVQLFLLPLLIKMSGVLSLISFAVNLIVLPLIPMAMLTTFLTGIFGIFGHIISWPFGALSYLLTGFIIKVIEIASKIPFAFLNINFIPTWLVIVWYGVYAFAFMKLSSITDQFKLERKSST